MHELANYVEYGTDKPILTRAGLIEATMDLMRQVNPSITLYHVDITNHPTPTPKPDAVRDILYAVFGGQVAIGMIPSNEFVVVQVTPAAWEAEAIAKRDTTLSALTISGYTAQVGYAKIESDLQAALISAYDQTHTPGDYLIRAQHWVLIL